MTAPVRPRWPSEKALAAALAALKKAAGGVGGIRVNRDGSFDVFAPGEGPGLAEDKESAEIAERIRRASAGG